MSNELKFMLFKRYVHHTVFILQFARKSYPGPSQPKNNDLRSALFFILSQQNMERSPRHLQNIKFSRIQAGDPQIWSFSTVDLLELYFPLHA